MFIESHEAIKYVGQLVVDGAYAYFVHHYAAPCLPAPNFFKKHSPWLLAVVTAFPVQFIVYQSYSGERPWYAWGLIILLIPAFVAAGWLCYWISTAKLASRDIAPGVLLARYPRFRRKSTRLFWGSVCIYIVF